MTEPGNAPGETNTGSRGARGARGATGDIGPMGPPGLGVDQPEAIKPVLEASAVVAHRVSKDTAKRELSRIVFRVTLREVLIFMVLSAAVLSAVLYFGEQHTSDQQKLKDRRDLINTRISDLQSDISDLRKLIQELRAALLKAGVNPQQIPALPTPSPSASRSNRAAGAPGLAPSPTVVASHPSPVADRSGTPSPSASTTSTTPSSAPSSTPSALLSVGPISVPVLSATVPPIRIPAPSGPGRTVVRETVGCAAIAR